MTRDVVNRPTCECRSEAGSAEFASADDSPLAGCRDDRKQVPAYVVAQRRHLVGALSVAMQALVMAVIVINSGWVALRLCV